MVSSRFKLAVPVSFFYRMLTSHRIVALCAAASFQ